jgi:putative tryptophan/tyrosine transport system substrate-binding protein
LRRRSFLTAIAGIAAYPLSAAAQGTMPLIGYLNRRSAQSDAPFVAAFRRGLAEQNLVEGRNIQIDYRWADNDPSRLPSLGTDLIKRKPSLIVAGGGAETTLALQKLTSSIPIVFITGADPIKVGMVKSLSRPQGNATGVAFLATAIVTKRLDMLHDFVPRARAIGILVNPSNVGYAAMAQDLEQARSTVSFQVKVFKATRESEIQAAFSEMPRQNVDALLIGSDNYFNAVRRQLIALALRHSLPAMFDLREFAAEGGLMSYGASQTDAYRQGATYVRRILGGAKPADLPVSQSTQFELIINRTTAKALNLEIPNKLVALADEIIE